MLVVNHTREGPQRLLSHNADGKSTTRAAYNITPSMHIMRGAGKIDLTLAT
jgi:hypothetical protein